MLASVTKWNQASLVEACFVSFFDNFNDLCRILIIYLFFFKPMLLFGRFENRLHHLLGFSSRFLQRTSSIKGCSPGRMPLRANTGARFVWASHVLLLSFPPVLRILNCSFIQERSFFQATKGPDLLFGVMELEIMDIYLQRTFTVQS